MAKCRCEGAYYDNWTHWAVLRRGERSRLYCLVCRAEWNSGAKYVALLPDHKPRSRSGLTDSEILGRINNGSLAVDCQTATVYGAGGIPLRVIEREHPDGAQRGTYRFVSVCCRGKKKKVALHRLVWMAANRSTVPDGYDIDHVRSQTDDTIENLRLLKSSENRATAGRKRQEDEVPF